jgi:hypothetical protein
MDVQKKQQQCHVGELTHRTKAKKPLYFACMYTNLFFEILMNGGWLVRSIPLNPSILEIKLKPGTVLYSDIK